MKSTRVSATGGRYSKGIISSGVFTPEQLRYLEEEFEKIVAVIANHDEGLTETYLPDAGDADHVLTKASGGDYDVEWSAISITEAQISDLQSYLTSETSHADVVVDGDFSSNGFMKRTGAGAYSTSTTVNLASEVTGNLGVSSLNSGTSASSSTYWRGDGTWATPAGGGSTSIPYCKLSKSSTVNQNVGGANSTEVFWTWDGQVNIDTDSFTHSTSTNSERLAVDADGHYEIIFKGQCMQTGSARSTLHGIYRINGGATIRTGTGRNYSRGAAYGNITASVHDIVELSTDDYIEVGTRVEDTDSSYTINTSGSEISDAAHVFIIKKIQ